MRGSLGLLLVSACWTRASEPTAPKAQRQRCRGRDHVRAVLGACGRRFRHARGGQPLVACDPRGLCGARAVLRGAATLFPAGHNARDAGALRDPRPAATRGGTEASADDQARMARHGDDRGSASLDQGCASLGIDPRKQWRTNAGVSVAFLLRDSAGLPDPEQVLAMLAPSTWTCIATEPAGMCNELERRCGPNASPERAGERSVCELRARPRLVRRAERSGRRRSLRRRCDSAGAR